MNINLNYIKHWTPCLAHKYSRHFLPYLRMLLQHLVFEKIFPYVYPLPLLLVAPTHPKLESTIAIDASNKWQLFLLFFQKMFEKTNRFSIILNYFPYEDGVAYIYTSLNPFQKIMFNLVERVVLKKRMKLSKVYDHDH